MLVWRGAGSTTGADRRAPARWTICWIVDTTFGGIHVTVGSLLGGLLVFSLLPRRDLACIKRLLHRYGQRNQHVNQSTLYTVERLFRYLMLVVGLLWALGVAGIPIAKMTVFAGALGVGLGFGLQAIFNNFVSGLILLFDRSLKVGDFVELASGRARACARNPHPRHADQHQ